MPKTLRAAVAAGAALAALVLAGSALAAFTPHLIVSHQVYATGASSETTISLTASQTDNSIAKITIYAPQSYGATLNQAVGTQLGTVVARAYSNQLQGTITISGKVVIANQTDASIQQASKACTGTPRHAAVWMLALSAAGTPLNIPVFVDPATGAGQVFASTTLQICLTSPDIPTAAGGAPFGAKVLQATMALNGVFTEPASPDQYVWSAFFTPYLAGTGTPNPAGTVEARSIVPIPTSVTLKPKYLARTNTFRLAGSVRQATSTATIAGLGPIRVVFYRGSSAAKLRSASSTRTNAKGTFATAGHLKPRKTTFFQARVTRPVEDVTPSGCAQTSAAPAGCVSATLAPIDVRSRVVAVRLKR